MCGIAGVFNFGEGSPPLTTDLLIGLREAIRHRGPDDEGVWINPARDLGLAHRRLSIVDLSPDGRQPMPNERENVWVTFNGEIYNHEGWRPRLERKGHRFRSRSDTEVIVHLYEEYGPGCVEHLDGMFAFGLWDAGARVLLLARDRLGVKPLYYTVQGGSLIFASEIKAILAHPRVGRDLDLEALGHYLSFKATPAPSTLFAGIRKLPAGSLLTCDDRGRVGVTPYWDAVSAGEPPLAEVGEEEAVATVRDLLTRSVEQRMMSDVPLGVFLSGGLDSSAIVSLMAARASRPVRTFSLGLRDLPAHNELHHARKVAERFGTEHREILIGKEEVEDYLPRLVATQDEPLADPVCVPLYYLARLARDSGVKVVMVGEGSDEQFLGYGSRVDVLRRYQRTWRPLLGLPGGVLRGLHGAAVATRKATGRGARFERVLGLAARGEPPFRGSPGLTDAVKARVLTTAAAGLGGDPDRLVAEVCAPLRRAWPRREAAATMAYLDIKLRLAELLLMRIDKVTMSVGVEAREPFLDHRLVEYVMRLPLRLKLKGWEPKHLLKRAMRGLVPEEIIRRPKQAFSAPVGEWLRQGLDGYLRRVILGSGLRRRGLFRYEGIEAMLDEHARGGADHGVALWTLANLSAWYDHWFEAVA